MITHQAGHDFSSGSRLQSAGWFHLNVDAVNCPPTKSDGSLMPNGFLQLFTTVCTGTAPGCKDKQWELVLWEPKPENPDYGQRINDRALIALGVMDVSDKGAAIDFNPADLVGRQFIAHIEANEYNGKTSYRLAYGDIFHIDDTEVESYPKHEEMLAIFTAKFPHLRRVKKQAAAASKGSPPMPKPPAPKPAMTPIQEAEANPRSFDDLNI